MKVQLLPLSRGRAAVVALEELEIVAKGALPFVVPQQETILQTYLAAYDADVCLVSRLSTTHYCVINYSSQGDVGVRVCCFPSAPSIGARIARSMHSTHQLTQNECKNDLQWHEFAKKAFHILFQNNSQTIHFTLGCLIVVKMTQAQNPI